MQGVGLFGAILIGLVAGLLAGRLIKPAHSLVTNMAVGLVGSLIGGFVAQALGIAWQGWVGGLIASTLGAVVLLVLLGLVRRPS